LIKDQTNKILLHSSIEIGKRLSEAKEMVGHGNWSKWLEEEVKYSQRTAQNLIKIHEEYGLKSLENSNSQALADLGYTQAVAMLRLDSEEREKFVLENDVDDMTTRELDGAIKEKKELEEEKEKLEKELKEITDKESAQANELKKRVDEIEDYEKKIKEAAKEKKDLKEELKQLKEQSETGPAASDEAIDPEEVEKLNAELHEKDKELKRLKAELKKKPKEVEIEVEVEKEVEVVPEEMVEELETLKKKINASNGAIKFKSTFEIIVNLFNDLVEVVDEMEASSLEDHTKYKGAVNKMLEQLRIE